MSIDKKAFAHAAQITADWRSNPANGPHFSWEQFRVFLEAYDSVRELPAKEQPDDCREALYDIRRLAELGAKLSSLSETISNLQHIQQLAEQALATPEGEAAQAVALGRKKNFAVLAEKCPRCGDKLIHNNTGIECGAMLCDFHAGGEPYSQPTMRESGWQPIETAPRGEKVLMVSTNEGKDKIPTVGDWGIFCKYNHPQFTHWMPMPEIPRRG